MTTIKKTGYVVAKRASASGKLRDVFATLSSQGGVTRVMDADSYERAAKRAGSVLKSNASATPYVLSMDPASSRRK